MATTAGCVDPAFGYVYSSSISGPPLFDHAEVLDAKSKFPVGLIPVYEGKNEADFEEWGDKVRKLYKIYGVRAGAKYMIDHLRCRVSCLLEEAAANAYMYHCDDLDNWLDAIAREVYPRSNYLVEHYMTFFEWNDLSPRELQDRLTRKLERHCRLCIRWNTSLVIQRQPVEFTIRKIIPRIVQNVIDAQCPGVPVVPQG